MVARLDGLTRDFNPGERHMSRQNTLLLGVGLAGCTLMLCVGLLLVGVGGYWMWRNAERAPAAAPSREGRPQAQSEALPDFTAVDLEGRTWRLSDLKGRPVAINFWATWCPPCREELPELQRLAQKYEQDGLVVLLVNVDEPEAVVSDYLQEQGIELPCVLDRGELVRQFRVTGLPTTVLVTPEGTLGGRILGWQGPSYLERGIRRIVSPRD